jgi:hypothetical protein
VLGHFLEEPNPQSDKQLELALKIFYSNKSFGVTCTFCWATISPAPNSLDTRMSDTICCVTFSFLEQRNKQQQPTTTNKAENTYKLAAVSLDQHLSIKIRSVSEAIGATKNA